MEDHLLGCIRSNLSLGLYENARFLGERLVAANPSEVRAACKALYSCTHFGRDVTLKYCQRTKP
jgi:hypothetical protein